MDVKTPVPNQQPTGDRPYGSVRWFGEFGLQAVAADSNELASAIEDFLRDYPLARGRREGLRYMLFMVPMGRRMHAVSVEPSTPDGATLEARIPVGRPVSRRAQLSTIGWALERASSGTRYYTRRFIANRSAPTEIVTAVDEANRALYGSRAKDIRWSLNVSPTYLDGEARDAGESPLERPSRVRAARLRDNAARMALATLPNPRLRLKPDDITTLVADFRRSRDAVKGRYAVAVDELSAPPERIATAILKASQMTTDAAEQRHLAEDLVDLQAFVDLHGQAAPLAPAPGQRPPLILELVRSRQAAAIAFIRDDPSVLGAKVAQGGRWTAIGEARAGLNRARTHRESQLAGFGGVLVWIVAAPAGAIVASLFGLGEFTLATAVVLFVGWWLSPWLGGFAERLESRLWEEAIEPRWAHAPNSLAMVLFFVPLAAVEFACGVAILFVTSRLVLG